MKIQLIILICGVILFSCKNDIESTIDGAWSIDSIYYKCYDLKYCLLGNIIEFDLNKKTELPIADIYCRPVVNKSFDSSASVVLLEQYQINDSIPLHIQFNTENEIFNGIHKLGFFKDEKEKLLKMVICSDSLYIVCRKGFYNYDKHLSTINKLVELSKHR